LACEEPVRSSKGKTTATNLDNTEVGGGFEELVHCPNIQVCIYRIVVM
jgi:hypothetical protein